jgi:hypothetical protein
MKTLKFDYLKENETSTREVIVFEQTEKSIKGIDVSLLNEEEKINILEIFRKHEEDIKPYMKAFRHFKVEKCL